METPTCRGLPGPGDVRRSPPTRHCQPAGRHITPARGRAHAGHRSAEPAMAAARVSVAALPVRDMSRRPAWRGHACTGYSGKLIWSTWITTRVSVRDGRRCMWTAKGVPSPPRWRRTHRGGRWTLSLWTLACASPTSRERLATRRPEPDRRFGQYPGGHVSGAGSALEVGVRYDQTARRQACACAGTIEVSRGHRPGPARPRRRRIS